MSGLLPHAADPTDVRSAHRALDRVDPAGSGNDQRRPSTRSAVMWAYALTAGRFGTTAVSTFVMAAILGPRAFGIMALAMLWVSFAQTLAMRGPAMAVIQHEDLTYRHVDGAFWATAGSGLALAALLAGISPIWSSINNTPELAQVCWALTPAIVLNAVAAVPEALVRRDMGFRTLSIRVVVAGSISSVVGIVLALSGFGVWALVVQQLLLATISAVAIWLITPWRPRRGPIVSALRGIRRFSAHTISEYLAYFLSARADALLLGAFFGPVAIGLYRLATRITDIVNELTSQGLGQVTLPHLSRLNTNRDAFGDQLAKVVHAAAIMSLPAFGILAVVAPHFLALLGSEWLDAVPAVVVLCVSGPFGVLAAVLAPAVQAAGRPAAVAALAWANALATVAALVIAGLLFASATSLVQVTTIAMVMSGIHIVYVLVLLIVVFRSILNLRIAPVLRTAVPAGLAAAAGAAAGLTLQPLMGDMSALAAVLLTTTVATTAAALVLIWLDAEARGTGMRLLRRTLRRH